VYLTRGKLGLLLALVGIVASLGLSPVLLLIAFVSYLVGRATH
jgi:hypothetical protein